MEAVQKDTTDSTRILGDVKLSKVLGGPVYGRTLARYLKGQLVAVSANGNYPSLARVVLDAGERVKVEVFSVYRETFLTATYVPRTQVLGVAEVE